MDRHERDDRGKNPGFTLRRPSGEVQAILAAGGLIPFLKAHPDWKIQ